MAHHVSRQRILCVDPVVKAVLETCDDSLKGKRDRALLLFAWASGGRRRSEVSEAVFENLHRGDEGAYLYTLASSKTNHNGKIRPEDVKPVVGSAAEALEAWLEASGITSGPLPAHPQEREARHRWALGDGGAGHREGAVCAGRCGRGFLGAFAAVGVRHRGGAAEHAAAGNDGDDGASEHGYGGGILPDWSRPGERGGKG